MYVHMNVCTYVCLYPITMTTDSISGDNKWVLLKVGTEKREMGNEKWETGNGKQETRTSSLAS